MILLLHLKKSLVHASIKNYLSAWLCKLGICLALEREARGTILLFTDWL